MGNGWTDIVFLTDEQYEKEKSRRERRRSERTNNNP